MEELKIMLGEKLYKEYIDFIEENRTGRLKYKTETHHILPKCLFPEYKDLKIHPWNSVELSHRNHFIAHYILAKSGVAELCVAFFINNLYKDFNVNDEDYLVNYEEIKRIAVIKNSEGVKKWRASLTDEENAKLINKQKLGLRKFYDEIVDEEFFKNRGAIFKQTLNNRTQEEWDKINEKMIASRLSNNINSYIDGGKKAAETAKNNILENGLSAKENGTIKMIETRINNGSYQNEEIKNKRKDTMYSKIDENGLNGFQQAYWKGRESIDTKEVSLKAAETMNNTILENGLSIKENRLKNRHNTMSTIGEDGLSGYQRAALNRTHDTRVFYKIQIFNSNNEICESYDEIQIDELLSISGIPIKLLWSGKIYKISKNTRKQNKQYAGYYLIKEKLNKIAR